MNPSQVDLPVDLLGDGVLLHVHQQPGPQSRVLDPHSQLTVCVLPSLRYRQGLVELDCLEENNQPGAESVIDGNQP